MGNKKLIDEVVMMPYGWRVSFDENLEDAKEKILKELQEIYDFKDKQTVELYQKREVDGIHFTAITTKYNGELNLGDFNRLKG